jgi:hypothetical protein
MRTMQETWPVLSTKMTELSGPLCQTLGMKLFLFIVIFYTCVHTETNTFCCWSSVILDKYERLTLSLLMLYIYGAPSKARNLTSYIFGRYFLLGILLLEPCISLMYAWKTNKYTNYSLNLLIMYDISYMFWHYIAIPRERSNCLLRDVQLRSISQKALRTLPEDGNVILKHVGATIHN